MILILAGTTEGRETSLTLQQQGYNIITSVATEYGAKLLRTAGVKRVVFGRLTGNQWLDFFTTHKISLVVDATHPFAVEVSRQAIAACKQREILYYRLERPMLPLPKSSLVHPASSLSQGVETACVLGKTCFSTLGSKHLDYLVARAYSHGVTIIARVLASQKVISHCKDLGLRDEQIIAVQGPFSHDINIQHYLQAGADVILTKESGINGGFNEKLTAALALNLPIVVWQRPTLSYPRIMTTMDELFEVLANINLQKG